MHFIVLLASVCQHEMVKDIVVSIQLVSCDCPVGSSGAMCMDDFNPCVIEPCLPDAVCVDEAAPSLQVMCNCLHGFSGDGFRTCQGKI